VAEYTEEQIEALRKKWAGVFKDDYTQEEIEELRARWIGLESLAKDIFDILKGNENDIPTDQMNIINKDRILLAYDILLSSCIPPEPFLVWYKYKVDCPRLDLRGIRLSDMKCKNAVYTFSYLDGALFSGSVFQKSDFRWSNMTKCDIRGATFDDGFFIGARLNDSIIHWSNFNRIMGVGISLENSNLFCSDFSKSVISGSNMRSANLTGAHFEVVNMMNSNLDNLYGINTHFEGSILANVTMRNAYLPESFFSGAVLFNANLSYSGLEKCDFRGTDFSETVFDGISLKGSRVGLLSENNFNEECKLEKDIKNEVVKERFNTCFSNNRFLPRILSPITKPKLQFKRLFEGWDYTNFYEVRIEDANISFSLNLRRYIYDQRYLRSFKSNHPFLYRIWQISCDCGNSISLWAAWSLLFATIWGFVYKTTGPARFNLGGEEWSWFAPFYYSIVTFTTLGFGDITPKLGEWGLQMLVTAEVIMGYIMLGGLISIFANKLARRS